MDYAFAPGTTSYDRGVKTFFKKRPNTILIDKKTIKRVDQFIDFLETDNSIIKPVGSIFIAAHGNDGGQMFIPFADIDLDGNHKPDSVTTYKTLEVADTSNVNDISTAISDANTKLNIRGCKIGQDHARPFVEKLKLCFGGSIPVSAPKHFHIVHKLPNVGTLEYLGYDFTVYEKNFFKGKNARVELIDAFIAGNFKFADGTTRVPDTMWTIWLPRNVGAGKRTARFRINYSPALKTNKGATLSTLQIPIGKAFRAETQKYTYIITFPTGPIPKTSADRKNALQVNINADPAFSSAHPYPTFQKYELDSISEFISAFTWSFSILKGGKKLSCVGSRKQYTIMVPIAADPLGANNLLFNVSPDTGNTSTITPQIFENNSDLFLTV